jgi:thioesterase domain-containing protein
MIFRGLAAALGEDQPLYALQMLDEDITPDMAAADFAKLTEFYIQLIRQVQPQGPYRLAGWCVSGWIGYGIARRLEREGEEIDLLMIMDAWAPGYWIKRSFARRTLMRAVYRFQRLRWVGRRLLKASREERSLYIRRSLHGTAAAAARNIAVWLHRMDLPVQVRLTEEMRPSEQLEYTATRSFDTGALDGKVLIFRSEEQSRGPLLAEDMGWSELLGRSITVEQLPGDHQEIFNHAGAQMMARAARRILRDFPTEVDSGGGGDAVPSPA